ncbi:MAG: nucleotide exchange factor GrpE, partial [Pollutimonas bauzanensis]
MSAPNEPLDPKNEPSLDTSEQLEVNDGQDQAQDADAQAQEDWATLLSEAQEKVARYHDELLRA